MKILFLDTEYVRKSMDYPNICEFGYCIADENLEIIESNNFIINPNIDDSLWDTRIKNNILNRLMSEYKKSPTFDYYYPQLRQLLNDADIIIGHAIDCDHKYLLSNCKHYNLKKLRFDFFDAQIMYKEYIRTPKDIGLKKILNDLQIEEEHKAHDAQSDAISTFLYFKKLKEMFKLSLQELIATYPNAYRKDNKNSFGNKFREFLPKKKETITKDKSLIKPIKKIIKENNSKIRTTFTIRDIVGELFLTKINNFLS